MWIRLWQSLWFTLRQWPSKPHWQDTITEHRVTHGLNSSIPRDGPGFCHLQMCGNHLESALSWANDQRQKAEQEKAVAAGLLHSTTQLRATILKYFPFQTTGFLYHIMQDSPTMNSILVTFFTAVPPSPSHATRITDARTACAGTSH